MIKKLLIILFVSIFTLIIIYNKFENNDKKILLIYDNSSILRNDNFKENFNYYYDNITYKELIDHIKNNEYKIIKDKKIYLNQLISSSNVILININNEEYFRKCKKDNRIIKNYDLILSTYIYDLQKKLNRITNAKIYIIGNYCKNKSYNQELKIPYKYIKYSEISNFDL